MKDWTLLLPGVRAFNTERIASAKALGLGVHCGLNYVPSKDKLTSSSPGSVNVTLFGTVVVADIIS